MNVRALIFVPVLLMMSYFFAACTSTNLVRAQSVYAEFSATWYSVLKHQGIPVPRFLPEYGSPGLPPIETRNAEDSFQSQSFEIHFSKDLRPGTLRVDSVTIEGHFSPTRANCGTNSTTAIPAVKSVDFNRKTRIAKIDLESFLPNAAGYKIRLEGVISIDGNPLSFESSEHLFFVNYGDTDGDGILISTTKDDPDQALALFYFGRTIDAFSSPVLIGMDVDASGRIDQDDLDYIAFFNNCQVRDIDWFQSWSGG